MKMMGKTFFTRDSIVLRAVRSGKFNEPDANRGHNEYRGIEFN